MIFFPIGANWRLGVSKNSKPLSSAKRTVTPHSLLESATLNIKQFRPFFKSTNTLSSSSVKGSSTATVSTTFPLSQTFTASSEPIISSRLVPLFDAIKVNKYDTAKSTSPSSTSILLISPSSGSSSTFQIRSCVAYPSSVRVTLSPAFGAYSKLAKCDSGIPVAERR